MLSIIKDLSHDRKCLETALERQPLENSFYNLEEYFNQNMSWSCFFSTSSFCRCTTVTYMYISFTQHWPHLKIPFFSFLLRCVMWGIWSYLQPCICPHFLLHFPFLATWHTYFTAIVSRMLTRNNNTQTSRKYLYFVGYLCMVEPLLFLFNLNTLPPTW